MHKATVKHDGTLYLGDAAISQGYRPGVLVQVILTRAGSLILAIDDTPVTIEIAPRKLAPQPKRLPASHHLS